MGWSSMVIDGDGDDDDGDEDGVWSEKCNNFYQKIWNEWLLSVTQIESIFIYLKLDTIIIKGDFHNV